MADSDNLNRLLAGLDYYTGNAVLHVLSGWVEEHDERTLLSAGSSLARVISLKCEHRQPQLVADACRAYRHAIIERGGDRLALATLDVLEAYQAKIAVRKLLELVKRELLEMRQLRLPGV